MSIKVQWEHRLGDGETVEHGKGTLKQAMQSHFEWVKSCEAMLFVDYEAKTDIAIGRGRRPKIRWEVYGAAYAYTLAYCYCYLNHKTIGLVDHNKLEQSYRKERGL